MIRHQMIFPLLGLAVLFALMVGFSLNQKQVVQARSGFPWPVNSVESSMPDLSGERDVHTRKVRFFKFLLPLVRRENSRLEDTRKRLGYIQQQLLCNRELNARDRQWLNETCREYGLDGQDQEDLAFWPEVFLRVDQIPENLVLIQAANESAWGTSRFAREGNNLFGQWCFVPGCGMVPDVRPEGETYEVARFDSIEKSIAGYLHNLNTGHAYGDLREIRAHLKRRGKKVTALDLTGGLIRYSQRREAYVEDLRSMLRVNSPIIDEIRPAGSGKPEA